MLAHRFWGSYPVEHWELEDTKAPYLEESSTSWDDVAEEDAEIEAGTKLELEAMNEAAEVEIDRNTDTW